MTSPSSGAGAAAGRGGFSITSPTGLVLDPSDPDDAKILRRQRQAAVQAGREGRDRAKSTRGRHDLEGAYDAGAAEAAGARFIPLEEAEAAKGGGGAPSTAPAAGGTASKGPGWKSFRPTSPARVPTRAADAGGFAAGLALYTVAIIYIRYGPEGWIGWLKAKFLNQPIDPAGGGVQQATTPTTKNGKAAFV